MGHINLAAPVSHIWFVKGTPSHMGLLLDISPRNLEQVIYFAKFIVTKVDDEKKSQALKRLRDDAARQFSELEKSLADKIDGLKSQEVSKKDEEKREKTQTAALNTIQNLSKN
jgi:DNA-directed RNA polymerase subunit beta'